MTYFKIGHEITLQELPNGSLFMYNGTLCLKTEYVSDSGAISIEAYIVGSGCMFWGGTSNPYKQRLIMERPVININ